MTLVPNLSTIASGDADDPTRDMSNWNAIRDIVNGNLDNNNIAAGAGIVNSKLADISTSRVINNNTQLQFENAAGSSDWVMFESTGDDLILRPEIAESSFVIQDKDNVRVFDVETDTPVIAAKNNGRIRAWNGDATKYVQMYHDDTDAKIACTQGDIEFTVEGNQILPASDNTIGLGKTVGGNQRWANVWSVLINGADIGFANKWKLREYPCSPEDVQTKSPQWMEKHANDGIQLLDENDNVKVVFHKDGNIYANGFKSLSELKD